MELGGACSHNESKNYLSPSNQKRKTWSKCNPHFLSSFKMKVTTAPLHTHVINKVYLVEAARICCSGKTAILSPEPINNWQSKTAFANIPPSFIDHLDELLTE